MITSDKEAITSPLYPDNYPINAKCAWLVYAPERHVVGFMFTDYEVGQGDYVELRVGKKTESYQSKPRLDHWRTTSERYLRVFFNSSKHFTFKGFEMKIKFVKMPKGKFLLIRIVITSLLFSKNAYK